MCSKVINGEEFTCENCSREPEDIEWIANKKDNYDDEVKKKIAKIEQDFHSNICNHCIIDEIAGDELTIPIEVEYERKEQLGIDIKVLLKNPSPYPSDVSHVIFNDSVGIEGEKEFCVHVSGAEKVDFMFRERNSHFKSIEKSESLISRIPYDTVDGNISVSVEPISELQNLDNININMINSSQKFTNPLSGADFDCKDCGRKKIGLRYVRWKSGDSKYYICEDCLSEKVVVTIEDIQLTGFREKRYPYMEHLLLANYKFDVSIKNPLRSNKRRATRLFTTDRRNKPVMPWIDVAIYQESGVCKTKTDKLTPVRGRIPLNSNEKDVLLSMPQPQDINQLRVVNQIESVVNVPDGDEFLEYQFNCERELTDTPLTVRL